jgi:hypothetical protein
MELRQLPTASTAPRRRPTLLRSAALVGLAALIVVARTLDSND